DGVCSDPSRPELAKLGTSFGNRVRLWDPRNELDRCAKQIFSWLTASLSPFVGQGSHQKIAPGRQRQTALGSPDASTGCREPQSYYTRTSILLHTNIDEE